MRLFERDDSPYLWCEFYIPGQAEPIRKSTKQSNRRLALQAAQQLQQEASRPRPAETEHTVRQLFALYLDNLVDGDHADNTHRSYGGRAVKICEHLGDEVAARLTRERIEWYLQTRRFELRRVAHHHGEDEAVDIRTAPGTIRLELTILMSALKWARSRKMIAYDPKEIRPKFKAKKKPSAAYRWLTTPEYDALYVHYEKRRPHRAHWLAVACLTGMRKEEINQCLVGDVFFARDEIHCRGSKTVRSDRWIPIAPQLRPLLERLCAGRRADEPLVRRWGAAGGPYGVPAGCKAISIARATPHDLRRTFASWLLQRGVAERTIADLLGHEGTQLVREVYGHLGGDSYKRAIAVLGEAPSEQRTDNVRNEGPIPARTANIETTVTALSPHSTRTCADSAPIQEARCAISRNVSVARPPTG